MKAVQQRGMRPSLVDHVDTVRWNTILRMLVDVGRSDTSRYATALLQEVEEIF